MKSGVNFDRSIALGDVFETFPFGLPIGDGRVQRFDFLAAPNLKADFLPDGKVADHVDELILVADRFLI